MDTVSCFANKRCSVEVGRGRLFLCGQTICFYSVRGQKRPITVDIISHLSTYSVSEMVVAFFSHLHKRSAGRYLTQRMVYRTILLHNKYKAMEKI